MIYKVLNEKGKSFNGGNCLWSLPTQAEDGTWVPGEWMPEIAGPLVPCENGYHLCEDAQVVGWLGPAIYESEIDGDVIYADDKIVVRRVRLTRRTKWNDSVARQYARWCAFQVAHLWDMPDIVRQYLETGDESISDAAWAAARAAAWDAANAAARAAAWAARAAAWAAASDAAWDAAWDAANAAARAAAWDAAMAAARAAARDAAMAAAWDAANAAAREAQYEQFMKLTASGEAS